MPRLRLDTFRRRLDTTTAAVQRTKDDAELPGPTSPVDGDAGLRGLGDELERLAVDAGQHLVLRGRLDSGPGGPYVLSRHRNRRPHRTGVDAAHHARLAGGLGLADGDHLKAVLATGRSLIPGDRHRGCGRARSAGTDDLSAVQRVDVFISGGAGHRGPCDPQLHLAAGVGHRIGEVRDQRTEVRTRQLLTSRARRGRWFHGRGRLAGGRGCRLRFGGRRRFARRCAVIE